MASEIIIHPDWNYKTYSFDADLAIVVLDETIEYDEFIQSICLPDLSTGDILGNGTIVGWGKSEKNSYELTPSMLQVPIIPASCCYPKYPKLAEFSSCRMFCGGYEKEQKAPCYGDSGSGFFMLAENEVWIIQGIVSGSLFAEKYGCDINAYQLYTNVARFTDWIKTKMAENKTVVWEYKTFYCTHPTYSRE